MLSQRRKPMSAQLSFSTMSQRCDKVTVPPWWEQSSRGHLSRWGNFSRGHLSREQLSGEAKLWQGTIVRGAVIQRPIIPGATIQGVIIWGAIFLGGKFSGHHTNHTYDTDFIVTNDQVTSALNKFRNHPSIVMIKSKRKFDECFSFGPATYDDILKNPK